MWKIQICHFCLPSFLWSPLQTPNHLHFKVSCLKKELCWDSSSLQMNNVKKVNKKECYHSQLPLFPKNEAFASQFQRKQLSTSALFLNSVWESMSKPSSEVTAFFPWPGQSTAASKLIFEDSAASLFNSAASYLILSFFPTSVVTGLCFLKVFWLLNAFLTSEQSWNLTGKQKETGMLGNQNHEEQKSWFNFVC